MGQRPFLAPYFVPKTGNKKYFLFYDKYLPGRGMSEERNTKRYVF